MVKKRVCAKSSLALQKHKDANKDDQTLLINAMMKGQRFHVTCQLGIIATQTSKSNDDPTFLPVQKEYYHKTGNFHC